MVLQMKNARKKKYLLEICRRNYYVGIYLLVIVAFVVKFSQLSGKYKRI
jgi:hypothetical protein